MREDALTIWLPVWGEEHLEMLRRYTLPLLMQPANLPFQSWSRIYVDCYTDPEWAESAKQIIEAGLPNLPVEISMVIRSPETHYINQGIYRARTRDTRMLLQPADILWANGSIANLMTYARGGEATIAVPHLRVNLEEFKALFPEGAPALFTSTELVTLAFQIPHQNTKNCRVDQPNCCYEAGLALDKSVGSNIATLIHSIPAPFLVYITEGDLQFMGTGAADTWDHHWPEHLAREGRWRVMGSSDLAFAVELTKADSHYVRTGTDRKKEEFIGKGIHNFTSQSTIVCLRGSKPWTLT